MADQKLGAVYHVTFLVEQFSLLVDWHITLKEGNIYSSDYDIMLALTSPQTSAVSLAEALVIS